MRSGRWTSVLHKTNNVHDACFAPLPVWLCAWTSCVYHHCFPFESVLLTRRHHCSQRERNWRLRARMGVPRGRAKLIAVGTVTPIDRRWLTVNHVYRHASRKQNKGFLRGSLDSPDSLYFHLYRSISCIGFRSRGTPRWFYCIYTIEFMIFPNGMKHLEIDDLYVTKV